MKLNSIIMEAHIEVGESFIKDGKRYFVLNFAGCNYNCPWCSYSNLMDTKEEYLINLRDIKNQLRENLLNIDCVYFTGGEPTLQRQALIHLATYAKDLNLKTMLHTNGSKPSALRSLLQLDLIDSLVIDMKSPQENELFERVTRSKNFFVRTESILSDIEETLKLLHEHKDKLDLEIRTTVVPALLYRKEDIMGIAKEIEFLDCRWVLQPFRPGTTNSKIYLDVNPPSEQFMNNIKESIQNKYYHLKIEIEDLYTSE